MHGNAGDKGIATAKFLADLFSFDEVLVGSAWVNSAKPGQTVSTARLWGKHIALLHRDRHAGSGSKKATFGFTAQYGSRFAGSTPDKNIGARGGVRVRAGESVGEVIAASDLGYFIENAVA